MVKRMDTRLAYVGRLAHIVAVLIRFYPLHWLGLLVRRVPWLGRRLTAVPPPEQRFRAMLEALGGTFIKFGQVLSLQPDLVPLAYCDALFDLLDRVPPFGYDDVERTFREDLGRTPHEIFDRFDPQPFASASIGQVHRAVFEGGRLAVKIRRPTALRDFGGDIRLMSAALRVIELLRLRKYYSYRMPIREFIAWTQDELDYRTEARYMTRVGLNTCESAVARVPSVVENKSTSRILTTEFLEGTTLLEYLRSLERNDPAVAYELLKVGFQPEEFAENIIANFLGDVFRHGLFHADLHPANLLILPDNVVGYVDFGITGIISDHGRERVLGLILALSNREIEELYSGILQISEITDDSDLERFHNGLYELAEGWFEHGQIVPRLSASFTHIILDMLRLARDCGLLPHEEAVRYMRSVITVDGLIGRFAPEYDVRAGLERLSKKHLQNQLLENALSGDRMIESWIAMSHLARDGAIRLDALLDRLEPELGAPPSNGRRGATPGRKEQAASSLRLGLILIVVAILVALSGEPMHLGFNLLSAELLVLGIGSVLLARKVLQWMKAPQMKTPK